MAKNKKNKYVIIREDMMEDYNLDYNEAVIIVKILMLWKYGNNKDEYKYNPTSMSVLCNITNMTKKKIMPILSKIEEIDLFDVQKRRGCITKYKPTKKLSKYYNTKENEKLADNVEWE